MSHSKRPPLTEREVIEAFSDPGALNRTLRQWEEAGRRGAWVMDLWRKSNDRGGR